MPDKRKIIRKSITGFIIVSALFAATVITIRQLAQRYIEEHLSELSIEVSQTRLDLLSRSVTLKNITWCSPDTSRSSPRDSLGMRSIRVTGIALIPLVLRKVFLARSIEIDSGTIEVNTNHLRTLSEDNKPSALSAMSVDVVKINCLRFIFRNDTIEEYSGRLDLNVGGIQVSKIQKANPLANASIDHFNIQLSQFRFHKTGTLYETEVAHIVADSKVQSLSIDSVTLKPLFDKYEFGRIKGKQADWIALFVPYIHIFGIDFTRIRDRIVHIQGIDIERAKLDLFRDKRVPFVPGDNIPLPMAMIGKIPFTVAIDSVHIRESAIFYEVFPEHGFQTGNVSFEKLEATLDHISNHSFYTTHTQATMAAHATLMKQGLIAASFSLPYDENQQYRATGTITHLPLPQLNPILENLAFIRIVSGKLNALNFDFSYNDLKSTGSVLVNYEDLKIQSLTKEQEPTTKEFKSFLINTLLRNTKDKNLPRQKRTGLISFERDRKKAVFNLWFRSILSGLEKSVIDFPASPEKQKPKP